MKAPFPYFGGKSKIASIVWQHLGDVRHYIEPFFGSGAVLLNRPNYNPQRHIETINDKDGFICNVWRSIKFSPDKTAEWADYPVNHADLIARKCALIKAEKYLLENLIRDDEWHDPKMAGYWIWAASCWIGKDLSTETKTGKPDRQIPQLGSSGSGIHAISKNTKEMNFGKKGTIYAWFNELSNRFRNVRVVCGDWTRVCGGNWQDKNGICGIFFDPPYGHGIGKRCKNLYKHDSFTLSADVRKWCITRGAIPTYRIVLAGYEGEHNELENHGWKKYSWKTSGGYANTRKKSCSSACENSKLERLWISPHCIEYEIEIFNSGDCEYEIK